MATAVFLCRSRSDLVRCAGSALRRAGWASPLPPPQVPSTSHSALPLHRSLLEARRSRPRSRSSSSPRCRRSRLSLARYSASPIQPLQISCAQDLKKSHTLDQRLIASLSRPSSRHSLLLGPLRWPSLRPGAQPPAARLVGPPTWPVVAQGRRPIWLTLRAPGSLLRLAPLEAHPPSAAAQQRLAFMLPAARIRPAQ